MAQFEDYLDNSTLTWSDLNETTNNKIDRFAKLFQAYEEAHKAEDEKTASKYEAQLDTLDNEILGMIKKQDTPKEEPKVEDKVEEKVDAKEEPKVEAKEEPKVEVKVEKKEEPKEEEKSKSEEDDGWDFGILKVVMWLIPITPMPTPRPRLGKHGAYNPKKYQTIQK